MAAKGLWLCRRVDGVRTEPNAVDLLRTSAGPQSVKPGVGAVPRAACGRVCDKPGSRPYCGCERALALPARGRGANRTGCCRSASDFRRLTRHETGVGTAHRGLSQSFSDQCASCVRGQHGPTFGYEFRLQAPECLSLVGLSQTLAQVGRWTVPTQISRFVHHRQTEADRQHLVLLAHRPGAPEAKALS